MKTKPDFRPLRAVAIVAAALVLCTITVCPAEAQDGDATTRQLWDTGFLQQRPKPQKPRPRRKPTYNRKSTVAAKKTAGPAPKIPETLVGLTVWRLRPSTAKDKGAARMLTHEPATNKDVELTPERIDVDRPLQEGQFVRLSIETPRTGYLYIIDREVYADGTMSDPVLIFPTLRLNNGDNKVTAGSVVEIPAQNDNPAYFTLTRNRPDQVAEAITLLVTNEPLDDLEIGRDATVLDAKTVADWEAQWGAPTERLDLVGGVGTTYTQAEMKAGANGNAKLTQDDPLPQSIFRVDAKPGDPVFVTVPLKIGPKT